MELGISVENQVLSLSMADLQPIIDDCFAQGLDVTFTVTGNSMQPLFEHNRDQAVLTKADPNELKPGAIPLYIRKRGQFVLPRIARVENGAYTMVGDAQVALEKGIRPEQIVGVVKGIYRKGRYIDCGSAAYRLWVFLWLKLRRYRPYLLRIHRLPNKFRGGKSPV